MASGQQGASLLTRLLSPVFVFALGLLLVALDVALFSVSAAGRSPLLLAGIVAVVTGPVLRALMARPRGRTLLNAEGATVAANAPTWGEPDHGSGGTDGGGWDFGGGGGGDGGGGGG